MVGAAGAAAWSSGVGSAAGSGGWAKADVATNVTAGNAKVNARQATEAAMSWRAIRSAERDGDGEAGFAGFLVLAVHVLGRLGQSHHGGVEVHAMSGRNLVTGDRISGPGLDCSECAPLDARN